jgi:hypothetical protein
METFLLHPEMPQANTISDAYMSVIFHHLLVTSLACRLCFLHFGFKMTRNTNSKALMKILYPGWRGKFIISSNHVPFHSVSTDRCDREQYVWFWSELHLPARKKNHIDYN